MQFNGEPQTLNVIIVLPFSAFNTNKCPSVQPTANAAPNGWNANDTHSYPEWHVHNSFCLRHNAIFLSQPAVAKISSSG